MNAILSTNMIFAIYIGKLFSIHLSYFFMQVKFAKKKHHCYLFFWDLFTSPKIYFPMHRSFTHAFYIMSLHLQFIHFLKSICDASLIPTFFSLHPLK